ncbi:MAG: hypothetical protein SFZ24_01530 [Planctomycetota bacterium]|nr:hypothetical protein [Planctomycetota bacterium]
MTWALLLLSVGLYICREDLRVYYYTRHRGADLIREASIRAALLREIAAACVAYRTKFNQPPGSVNDLELVSPGIQAKINAPITWALYGRYKIRFDTLQSEGLEIFVDDPGYDWPGDPAVGGVMSPAVERFRVVLGNDLNVGPRDSILERMTVTRTNP